LIAMGRDSTLFAASEAVQGAVESAPRRRAAEEALWMR